ncbi:cardiolipin synthase [Natronospirillum operosum]|uniref:Cardiolipin synthase n=1 Tax=Natronospirillum operosum TaxID=2759953 RepID=A0A4Z0W6M0_9GAMM|nr:cardiolipin synthase [Natronospirillum operosum]TGG93464.1 cardiolipin synthase [Natronospirillum operosum]
MSDSFPIMSALVTAAYWLVTLSVVIRVLMRRRPVSSTLAWLLVILAVPIAGVLAYVLIGELSLGRRREALTIAMSREYLDDRSRYGVEATRNLPGGEAALAIHRLLQNLTGLCALSCQRLELLTTPEDIFSRLIADIDAAERNICMEFFIWYPGGKVDEAMAALERACARGVRVEILIDHAGSRSFFRSRRYRQMLAAGMEVTPALPVHLWRFLFRRLDLRLHRKLVVIDHHLAYTGSMNMADPACFQQDQGVGQWVDVMLRFEGQAAQALSRVFSWDWEVETEQRRGVAPPDAEPQGQEWLSVLPSGPGVGEDLIEQAVLAAVYRANHRIEICTPYFVPSEELFDALCHAARRQVQVDLIVPRRSNLRLVQWASQSYFETLLALGVRIYWFDDGLLHTKALMVDRELALVGSVNLDARSLQLNYELSMVLFTPASCELIVECLDDYRYRSQRLEADIWAKRPHRHRIMERILFFLSPLL